MQKKLILNQLRRKLLQLLLLKLNLLLNRYQMFRNSPWSLELLAQGQLAFANLDSVEKMSLGWPNGIRAYPPR